MNRPFKGTINIEGTPSVLYVVLDDVGEPWVDLEQELVAAFARD